jgi:hypothetical protein
MEKEVETFVVKNLDKLLENAWGKIFPFYQDFSTFRVIPILVGTSLIEIFEKLNLPKERKIMTVDELKTFFFSFSKEFLKDSPILGISLTPYKLWTEIKRAPHKIPLRAIILRPIPYDEILITCYEKNEKGEEKDGVLLQPWDVKIKEKIRR